MKLSAVLLAIVTAGLCGCSAEWSKEPLPTKYSLAENGCITSEKSQAASGMCWAFTTIKCVESSLLTRGYETDAEKLDLSENHLVWYTHDTADAPITDATPDGVYIQPSYDGVKYYVGAGWLTSVSALASGIGPVCEEEMPFRAALKQMTKETQKLADEGKTEKYGGEYLLCKAADLTGNSKAVKRSVMENGALMIGYCYDKNSFQKGDPVTYRNAEPNEANHAAAVIGWDDTIPKESFKNQPAHDGGWLIQDSAPNSLDCNNYYVAYDDPTIAFMGSMVMGKRADYGRIYQYDGVLDEGADYMESFLSVKGVETRAANVFTAEEDGLLTAVGIWTSMPNQQVTVSVCKDVPDGVPDGGQSAAEQKTVVGYAGYGIVELETPVQLKKGDTFSIVVSYRNCGDKGVLKVEGSGSDVDTGYVTVVSHFHSEKGESYIWIDGSGWCDLSEENTAKLLGRDAVQNNACIKAFVR